MTLQIRIAGARHPARDGDPLRRTECGYYRGITPTEAWRRGRAEWPLNGDNVKKETEAVVINPEGLILSVAIITGVISHGDKIEICSIETDCMFSA